MGPLLLPLIITLFAQEKPREYVDRITKWRAASEADLRKDGGWLTVVGLYWLQDGQSTGFGMDSAGHPVVSAGAALGSFSRSGTQVSLKLSPGSGVSLNGKPGADGVLALDSHRVTVGAATFMAIRRGDRIGIRVFDSKSEALAAFEGEKWFPIDPKYRISAKYMAYSTPRTMPITNVLGDTQPVSNPGYVEFVLHGKKCRLEAQDAGSGLFFNFSDATTGKSTYPAGRFLDAPKPVDGLVVLDFNQATNPPCAFTAFATCPLPPSANRLLVEVKAGEKTHHPFGKE